MIDALKPYTDFLKEDGWGQSEVKVTGEKIHPDISGTADSIKSWSARKHLQIGDLKYGRGVFVEAKGNHQLMTYALLYILESGFVPETIELVIIQPRYYHKDGPIRRHTITIFELFDFMLDLQADIKAATDPEARLRAGSWCRFCPAKLACPELKRKSLAAAQAAFEPERMSLNELALILAELPAFENWIKAVYDYAYTIAKNGHKVPGKKLVNKRPTRKWREERLEALRAYLQGPLVRMADEELYATKIRTPAQIMKSLSLSEEDRKTVKDEYTISVSSGLTLVDDSDPRDEVKSGAEEAFKNI